MTAETTPDNVGNEQNFLLNPPLVLYRAAIKPRIKLFLSADIVGSTAFKQTFKVDATRKETVTVTVGERRRWQRAIANFYSKARDRFPVIWDHHAQQVSNDVPNLRDMLCGEGPRFWKTVGDEVIFWKEITHEAQLWLVLQAWLDLIAELRPLLTEDGLDVKSVLWLAEFPVRNCALVTQVDQSKAARQAISTSIGDPTGLLGDTLPQDDAPAGSRVSIDPNLIFLGLCYDKPHQNAGSTDFIGPGIDVGFRIANFASQRRMALSVDVAYLLAVSRINIFQTSKPPTSRTAGGILRLAPDVETLVVKLEDALKHIAIPAHFSRSGSAGILLNEISIHYSGAEPLKGVLGGIKYPRFWINIVAAGSYEDRKQDMYLVEKRRIGPTWGALLRYCQAFYDERSDFIRAPVIIRDIDDMAASTRWSSTCDEDSFELYRKMHFAATAPEDLDGEQAA